MNNMPEHFVYLEDIDSTIIQDIQYATPNNIIGRPVEGYCVHRCIVTRPVAEILSIIQKELAVQSLGLKVFDCYRPQMAVDDFYQWSQDISQQQTKTQFYPRINKVDLFKLGFFIQKSGHSRGSTVDLTLVNLNDKSELDMGTPFDFMDELSFPSNTAIGIDQYKNRMILRNIMLKYHFMPLDTEWWHYTFENEPYRDFYFNFPIK